MPIAHCQTNPTMFMSLKVVLLNKDCAIILFIQFSRFKLRQK